jgi:pilus assembly protein CpaD
VKKVNTMRNSVGLDRRAQVRLAAGLTLALGLALCGCAGGVPTNRSMSSIHQPVVAKSDYTLDVTTGGANGTAGLAYGEQDRLAGWFQAMGLKYGDRIAIADPAASPVTRRTVEALASRYGLVVEAQAPLTVGDVQPGTARVIVSRSTASVPGCPDWSNKSDANPNNGLSSNFGCAINSNLAAMVANPEDLLHGAQDTGSTAIMTSNKAIATYRDSKTSGEGTALTATDTTKGS